MSVIVLPHTPVSGQVVPSVGQLGNFVAIRDAFNNTAVQTDVAKTIGVAHTWAADILFTDALYDIGKSGATRPRDIFLSRNLTVGGTAAITGAVTLSSTLAVTGISSFGSPASTAGANVGDVVLGNGKRLMSTNAGGTSAFPIIEVTAGNVISVGSTGAGVLVSGAVTLSSTLAVQTDGLIVDASKRVLIGTTVTAGSTAGETVLANGKGYKHMNAAGTTALNAISRDSSNDLVVDAAGFFVNFANAPTTTAVGAAGAASPLPANPVGYMAVKVSNTQYKIPYYNA